MVVKLTTFFPVKMNKNIVFLLLGLSFLLLNVVQVSGSGSESSGVVKNGGSVIKFAQLELGHEEDAEIVPKVSQEGKEGEYPEVDTGEILGIGKTLFIVVAVVVIVIVLGVPIICCIVCGCLCFRRNKKNNTTIVVPPYQQPQGQHPQQGQVQIQTNNFQNPYPQQYVAQPYNNNGYNYDQSADGNGQGKRYDDGYGPYNGNQKSASPPRQLGQQQQVGPNRYDQMGQYPGDPNLIPNRFKPPVPAKHGRVPGWTAVAAEVKIRNKLVMDNSQNSPYIPPAPISPDSNMNKNQRDYVRSTSTNSNQPQNQIQNPPHPHTHPQGHTNEAYDGGLTSLPQSPLPYPYSQSTNPNPNPNQGYNPNPNSTHYGSPPPQGGGGGYNGHNNDNFMY